MQRAWSPMFPLTDLPEGGMKAAVIGEQRVVVCRTREGLYALEDVCTHAHAHLSDGRLRGVRIICPLHGGSFDARDGKVLGAPAVRPLTCHDVRVTDGMIEVRLGSGAGTTTCG